MYKSAHHCQMYVPALLMLTMPLLKVMALTIITGHSGILLENNEMSAINLKVQLKDKKI